MTPERDTYWNAEVYERIVKPMCEWARAVIRDLDQFAQEVIAECERQTSRPFAVDYVRLDIWAVRPG